jgi:hypothetical protein
VPLSALQGLLSKIALTRQGSYVRRFHTKRLIGEQNLGHHSFGVVSLILILHPNPTISLIRAALWHDMAEQYIGDVPSPALRADSEYGTVYESLERDYLSKNLQLHMHSLAFEEHCWLWSVDKLECLLYSREQVQLGNSLFIDTCRILHHWFDNDFDCPAIVKQIVEKIGQSTITAINPQILPLEDILNNE